MNRPSLVMEQALLVVVSFHLVLLLLSIPLGGSSRLDPSPCSFVVHIVQWQFLLGGLLARRSPI